MQLFYTYMQLFKCISYQIGTFCINQLQHLLCFKKRIATFFMLYATFVTFFCKKGTLSYPQMQHYFFDFSTAYETIFFSNVDST